MGKSELPKVRQDWCDILNSYHGIACQLEQELGERHGLGLSEFSVLDALAQVCGEGPAKILMKELQGQLYLSQSAFSRTVTRLEKLGAVTRGACSSDRRAVFLATTPIGCRLWKEAEPTYLAVLERNLGSGRNADTKSAQSGATSTASG